MEGIADKNAETCSHVSHCNNVVFKAKAIDLKAAIICIFKDAEQLPKDGQNSRTIGDDFRTNSELVPAQ